MFDLLMGGGGLGLSRELLLDDAPVLDLLVGGGYSCELSDSEPGLSLMSAALIMFGGGGFLLLF